MKLVTTPCIFLVIWVAIQDIEVNSKLTSALEKREAVLKRLRELTLGQLED